MAHTIKSWLSDITIDFLSWFLSWISGISFWVISVGSVICLALFIVSWNRKFIQYIWIGIVIYVFLKGAEMSL